MNTDRKELRPIIKGLNTADNISIQEQFQNKTLRPIIKMQHNLLVAYFKEYLLNNKFKYNEATEIKKIVFISAAFQRDYAFKSELKGIILGQFTVAEFNLYTQHKSDFNKRILTMMQQRIVSVIELF